ncbi:MAG: AAA domain-containing protein [Planctomycetota bacterium]|jgi:very-short-patch-repair endonuclease
MADQSYNIDEATTRIGRVFRYLQELHRVRTPPNVRLDRYAWRLKLESLPYYPSIQRGRLFGNLKFLREGASQRHGNFILKVGRTKETECPPPSVIIEQWLRPGWDEPGAEPKVYAKRKLPTGSGEETFEDSTERVEALEDWMSLRHRWASAEKHVIDALGIFSEFFELWGRFARESEKYQLYLGDGILVVDGPEGQVRHPVLLQRVQLTFNPGVPEFNIGESQDTPYLYTPLLRYLGVDGKDIHELKSLASKQHAHPLGDDTTSHFLKSLVQQLWPNGEYFESEADVGHATEPYLYRQPYLYLGSSNQGFAEAIDRFLEALPSLGEHPESLLRVVGIDTDRNPDGPEESAGPDLLLTKDANPEQELVIHRLEETGAVLVQGPPGTGKSHTIANLIGHLLAQKKSILVTSHTSKALRVVRDHVAKPLQSLCVSVFYSDEESSKQLEESITGIVNYVSTTSKRKLRREIEQLSQSRDELKARHDELRDALLESIADEYRDIEVSGERISPSDAARKLIELKGVDDWIPGPLQENAEPPLTAAEFQELYTLNEKVTDDDEKMLTSPLPDPERLPLPKDFAALYDDINRLERTKLNLGSEYWHHEEQTLDSLFELVERVMEATEFLAAAEDWLLECVDAGRQPDGERQSWLSLVELIDQCCEEIPPKEELILAHGPKVAPDADGKELARICGQVIEHLESGKKLKRLSTMLKPEWQHFIDACRVDDGPPAKLAHFRAILNLLEVQAARENLLRRWDRQMASLNAPESPALGRKPEKTAKQFAEKIVTALNWYRERWSKCEESFAHNGLNWSRLASKAPVQQSSHGHILGIRDIVLNQLKPLIESRKDFLHWQLLCKRRDEWFRYLNEFSKKEGSYPLIKLFKHGVKKPHYDCYLQGWSRLQELMDLRPSFERRLELIGKLEEAAPAWAQAVRDRKAPHDKADLPGDVEAAWKYRHWDRILTNLNKIDLDAQQRLLTSVKQQLHEVTALYVEKLAWLAQLERTGLKQQQALNGWLGLHKKIGKGTGKHSGRLKEEARKTLVACRQAVPVWIMPLSRVVESFDLATTRFDVVIIDEASQSDVLGLVAFALGQQVAVVGDHEQVSPYAVGHELQTIQGLIDEILTDIPNKQLYDGKTSVYDLARQSFGGTIRLLEHFRCVPDIIQFSNQLCYGGEIRALREASASQVEPHLIAHRVRNGVAVNKVNREEGLVVASLVSAVCKLPEYEDCTIGVICMVGTDQALYIDSILRRRLTVAQYQKRRLLCGNASQFQGDERDVIFLSMVDSPSNRPLPIRQREEAVKVFNVAASRARDQLWVVHSLNAERDLKPGDLRLKLIAHAQDPRGLRKEVIEPEAGFSCEFEELVYKGMTQANYRTIRLCQVGEYVIDLVVEGAGGKRVAIQCDGDRSQPSEELTEAMQRQMTLERLGWTFIRLRGSEFLRDPDRGLKKLFRRLKEIGIDAIGPKTVDLKETTAAHDLKMKVLKRAELIRSRWKDIPDDPMEVDEPRETKSAA